MMLMTMTMRMQMQRLMKMLKMKTKTQGVHPKSTELHAQLDICLLLLLQIQELPNAQNFRDQLDIYPQM